MPTVVFLSKQDEKYVRCIVPHIPQIGSRVDGIATSFIHPLVTGVVNYPTKDTLRDYGVKVLEKSNDGYDSIRERCEDVCSARIFIE